MPLLRTGNAYRFASSTVGPNVRRANFPLVFLLTLAPFLSAALLRDCLESTTALWFLVLLLAAIGTR